MSLENDIQLNTAAVISNTVVVERLIDTIHAIWAQYRVKSINVDDSELSDEQPKPSKGKPVDVAYGLHARGKFSEDMIKKEMIPSEEENHRFGPIVKNSFEENKKDINNFKEMQTSLAEKEISKFNSNVTQDINLKNEDVEMDEASVGLSIKTLQRDITKAEKILLLCKTSDEFQSISRVSCNSSNSNSSNKTTYYFDDGSFSSFWYKYKKSIAYNHNKEIMLYRIF